MNITTLKDVLGRKIRGANLDSVQGISDYSLFKEAGVNLLLELNPIETVRHATLNIFDGIYDYAPATDVKSLADIRPQTYNRSRADNAQHLYLGEFDRRKQNQENEFSLEYQDASKVLRYARDVGNSIAVDETIDDNWTAGTGVSNIAEDTITYAEDGRSLRFDVSSGSNLISWNGTSTKDLSKHTNRSSFFRWVYYPDSSIITSLTLRVGSSSSDYYEITGAIHFGSIRTGWNLYRFNWDGVADSGTTDETKIDYVRLALVTTSADTDIRIGRLYSKLPSPREYVYYSNYLFRSSSGTFKEAPTVDTDIINLDIDAENLFVYECARIAARELQNRELVDEYTAWLYGVPATRKSKEIIGQYARYKARRPSEEKKKVGNYGMKPRWQRIY